MKQSHVITPEDLEPHGMRCIYCDRPPFKVGDEYVSVLTGMVGDTPLTEVVCPSCADQYERLERCETCEGTGSDAWNIGRVCDVCHGAGNLIPLPGVQGGDEA